jgi:hypothetical protein
MEAVLPSKNFFYMGTTQRYIPGEGKFHYFFLAVGGSRKKIGKLGRAIWAPLKVSAMRIHSPSRSPISSSPTSFALFFSHEAFSFTVRRKQQFPSEH